MPELLGENTLRDAVDVCVRLVEAAGAAVIVVGALTSLVGFLLALARRRHEQFVGVRLTLGRYLTLGLEFQLAADVLKTAIAPSFREIGQLAAVAAIRTALNFFLGREIQSERREVDDSASNGSQEGPGGRSHDQARQQQGPVRGR